MRSSRVAAVVANQVDLDEPGSGVVPVGPGTHRNLTFQQRPRLGGATPLEPIFGPFTSQATIDGGRRHRHQQHRGVLINDQLAEIAQHRHQLGQHRRQPFTGRHPQHRPADRQRGNDIRSVLQWLRISGRHDFGLQRRCECLAGMISVPPGVGAQLIEDPALTALTRQPVAVRGRLRHCPALGQRQPHPMDVRAHFQ